MAMPLSRFCSMGTCWEHLGTTFQAGEGYNALHCRPHGSMRVVREQAAELPQQGHMLGTQGTTGATEEGYMAMRRGTTQQHACGERAGPSRQKQQDCPP